MGKRTDRKKKESGNFRFVILLIFLSMIAIFLGFQIGNSFFASQMETEQEEIEIYEAEPDSENIEEEETTNEEITSAGEDNEISGEAVIDDSNQSEQTENTSEIDETNIGFYVQVGAFGNGDNANNLLEDLENRDFQVRIEGTEPYRVQVVGGSTRDDAEEVASELQGLGFETLIISQ